MSFQQLHSVREAVRHGFNLTEVANTLNASQSGVSRQIRELEEELGIDLIVRGGKQLTGLTEPGAQVLPLIKRLLTDADNLRQSSRDFSTPWSYRPITRRWTARPLTLQRLAQLPLITYDKCCTGRSHIDNAVKREGIKPSIVLTAMDADVIKTYVELGMGVGIVAAIAFEEDRDLNLRGLGAGHLFAVNMTRQAFRKGTFLRNYVYSFIETFARL